MDGEVIHKKDYRIGQKSLRALAPARLHVLISSLIFASSDLTANGERRTLHSKVESISVICKRWPVSC